MSETPVAPRWSDHEIDQVIGRLLQVGVLIASVVVLYGTILLLARHAGMHVDFSAFDGAPQGLRSLHGIAAGAMANDPLAVIQLGLILLIATPIARVALTCVAFIVQRDRLYVLLTSVVLALLLLGLLT